jgi:ABC-type dipeptide/oligopeptide/nickel transport system permease component
VKRLRHAAGTLALGFVLSFVLLQAIPGSPSERLDRPDVPVEQAARNRRALGLDAPLPAQFARTVASYAHGDLGVSFAKHRPVAVVLAEALPYTALLGAASLVLAYGLGVPWALILLTLPPRWRRRLDDCGLAVATVPRFWLSIMLILVFHSILGWLPASHATAAGVSASAGGLLAHLVLPALALALPSSFLVARTTLASIERVASSLHVKRARASGAAGTSLLLPHVLRAAAAPTLALAGLDLPVLASGAMVVETIFAWPGMGRVAAESVLAQDYPVALASCLTAAIGVVLGRLASQAVARRLDPRLREDAP